MDHPLLQLTLGGFTFIFTIVDRSTRLAAAFMVQDTSASTCIAALTEWILGFKVPATLTSYCGAQFTAFCKSLGLPSSGQQHGSSPLLVFVAPGAALGPP